MTSSPSDSYLSWLRGLGAEQLATLLRHRPDVVLPPPPGPRPLAKRLQLRSSVARALRSATALELATIEVAADLGAELSAISPEALTNTIVQRAQARGDTLADDEVTASVAKLTQLGLLYPTETGWRLVTEAMSALPGSFGLLPATPATQIQSRLDDLEPAQLHLLQSLARSGGIGHSRSAGVDADPAHPIPQLINAGLLERLDASHVRLPRTIARVLTGTPTHHLPLVRPLPHPAPASDAAQKAIDRVDTAGIAQGLEITRQVVELIDALGTQPIALNKDSSVPARATGQLARRLGYSPEEIKLLVAIAQSAGLLGTGLTGQVPEPLDPEANYLAPTRDVDDWLAGDLPARYARLLTGWLRSPHAHFHGGRLLDNDEVREALPELRRVALALYTHLPADRPLAAEDIASHLGFYAPLVATGAAHHDVGALIDEAHTLGALAHGAATTVVRELISGADPVATVAAHTPAEVEQFIVQADMTIMVPGPLPFELHRRLALIAELETPGLAAMFRITDASVRRGLDAGLSEREITEFLEEHSLGELPPTVTYLISDVARRHGGLRGGAALSYLRSDDDTLLAEVMASPAAEAAELTRLAPTVAISSLPLAKVLHHLREHGFSPVAENAEGATVDVRPEPARVFGRPQTPEVPRSGISEAKIDAAVSAVLGASAAPSATEPATDTPESPESPTTTLQLAARSRRQVRIVAVDKHGQRLEMTVLPLSVSGGQVDGLDEASGQVRRLLIHRITEVTFA